MGHLKAYYEKIVSLSEAEWNFIAARFERWQFSKHDVITRQGDTEDYLSFIETGVTRSYVCQGEERELTFNFSFDREFTCAYDSFLMRVPSAYAVQALTDVVMWRIAHSDLQEVYARTAAGNRLGRWAAEQLFLMKSKRELTLLQDDATARYLGLLHHQPHIIRQVPLKYIASYIGVTPQALSRIRRQIT